MNTDSNLPTVKQRAVIEKIIAYYGINQVEAYFHDRFPGGDFSNMTRKQAQKIITGMPDNYSRRAITAGIGPRTLPDEYWRKE